MHRRLSIMVLAAALAGCAVPSPAPDRALQGDVVRLQGEQEALSLRMQRLQDNLLLIEARVQDQQRLIDAMRQGLAAQKVTATGEMTVSAAPAATSPAEGVAALSPTEIYLQAFADYASGRFAEAIAGFESFLSRYPDSDYAGNAQYWLGECYYSLQQPALAAEAFGKVAAHYPQGGKAAEALLKMALALRQMNQDEQAGQALQLLRERYPDSAAARKSLEIEQTPNTSPR